MINLFYRSVTKVIKKLLKKFENFYKFLRFKIYDLRINNSLNYSKVPKILFTSYCCSREDIYIDSILKKWKKLNNDFEIRYFSDKDLDIFFEKKYKYLETFKKLNNGVAKADFFRLVFICEYGGYWFDLDLEPFKVVTPKKGSAHFFDMGFKNISYMFIGGSPNKLFNLTLKKVCKNIDKNYPNKLDNIVDITGPRVIQEILSKKLQFSLDNNRFKGTIQSKTFLENSEFEFEYMCQRNFSLKTDLYNKLQKKYKKKNYTEYNHI